MEMCQGAGATAPHGIQTGSRTVYEIQPLQDRRWSELVDRHPRSSAFHTAAWLNALHRTYGYEPIAYTTSPPGACLENGVVFCRVASWITGRRIISLPFSDHCQPLLQNVETWRLLVSFLQSEVHRDGFRYVELRCLESPGAALTYLSYSVAARFTYHKLDLRPDLDSLFRSFHKSCIQRRIGRAEREHLVYEEGRSDPLLNNFYKLLVLTRRRHGLPPQPFVWFQNLAACLGDRLTIRQVSKDGQAVACMLTIAHRHTLVYKYGCSDGRFHNLGGMPLLFWMTIQKAKQAGFAELDLGRSDADNPGLVLFKNRLGARSSGLTYYRYPQSSSTSVAMKWSARTRRYVFSRLPAALLVRAADLLYKHVG
jgi:hypothetical protein